jgi:Tfp pilus assembly protein PilX
MHVLSPSKSKTSQTGGITILVALMMLVLLTLSAVSMSRNSFRAVVSSGFSRQGAMARNVADSGLEWAMYWMTPANSPAATNSAASLNNEMNFLRANNNQGATSMAGVAYDIQTGAVYTPGSLPRMALKGDLSWTTSGSVTEGYTIGVTRMGKLPITGMSQGAGPGAFSPASGAPMLQAPDLWAIRSDAQVTQGSGAGSVTFTHAREAWVSTPVQ